MITLLQGLITLFIAFAVSRTWLRAKDKKIKQRQLFFWLTVWGTLIFTTFFPEPTTLIAKFLGISRGSDFIIYSSTGILFYLVFKLYVKLEEIDMNLTKLVRAIALSKKIEEDKK